MAHFQELIEPSDDSIEIDPVWQNSQFSQHAAECDAAAGEAFPNPVDHLAILLDDTTKQISDLARADERYVAAQSAFRGCVQEGGYSPDDVQTLMSDISEDGATIVGQYRSGSITADEAVEQLDQLEDREDRATTILDECGADLVAEERAVVAEMQEEHLHDNPGFILGLTQEMETAVDQYRRYLSGG